MISDLAPTAKVNPADGVWMRRSSVGDQIIARPCAPGQRTSFEPEEKTMRIRMRIDGILYQDVLVPKSMQSPVIARLKIMPI